MATGTPRSPAHWVLGWQTLSYSLASLLQPRFSPLAGALGGRERPVKSLTRAQGARRGLVKSRSERAPGPALAGVTSCQTLGTTTWTGPTSSSRPCARATSSRSIFVWRRRAPPRPRRRASRLFQRSTCPSSRSPTTTPGSSPARPRTCDSATWRATTAGTNARWGSRRAAPTRVEINRHAIEHGDTVDGLETPRPRTDAAAETTSRR